MKQELIILSLVVAIFSGCTEKKDMEFPPVDASGYTLITADIESLLMMEDKLLWPEEAAIGVYGSEKGDNEYYTIKNASAGYSSAVFYGPLVKGNITAYYPYSSTYVASADAMPVQIEHTQSYNSQNDAVAQYLQYTPQAFGYMSGDKVSFVYPSGILSVNFEGDEPVYITDISLSSQTQHLSGHAVFRADGTMDMTSNSFDYVLLDCGEGVPTVSNGQSAVFYMVLAPGTYSDLTLSIGFKGNEKKFTCIVPEVTIQSTGAEGFRVTSMKLNLSSPDSFEEENVEFDE